MNLPWWPLRLAVNAWQTSCREHQKEIGITLHSWRSYNEQRTDQPQQCGLEWYPPWWCRLLVLSTNQLHADQQEPGVARSHQVITTLFSTRIGSQMVVLWHAAIGTKSLHWDPKADPTYGGQCGITAGTAKFAFYVELTCVNPKAKWFILLVKKKNPH